MIDPSPFVVESPRSGTLAYPVRYGVARPARFSRQQLLIRAAAFIVLGLLGLSFATLFTLAYLGLPLYIAIRNASPDVRVADLRDDRRRVLVFLRWFAAVSAWVGLTVDRLPARRPEETVSLTVAVPASRPTTAAAILRTLTGLPSALVLMVLCGMGMLVWLWAALSILFAERVGAGASAYLVGLQRWSVRLLAYQACLVDAYPPFSFAEDTTTAGVTA
ncbi:DUF4389 domain-containing protein [Nannocystis sp. ILAH1]|uniref:DUF4389 domain-containing protein n=1 Tax=Nannocystis sp. ILAH1 TaxID=2996789 RepID=UPI002270A3D0|nr:DUF4389 domain-containing protein [Nannocystis sp. ILAH1]MCY0989776.1 DUF4389 domain-containing protein [Nannocystis sp. ILAH1]